MWENATLIVYRLDCHVSLFQTWTSMKIQPLSCLRNARVTLDVSEREPRIEHVWNVTLVKRVGRVGSFWMRATFAFESCLFCWKIRQTKAKNFNCQRCDINLASKTTREFKRVTIKGLILTWQGWICNLNKFCELAILLMRKTNGVWSTRDLWKILLSEV